MGFFKGFKDDFSQAVNDLIPGEDGYTAQGDELPNDDMLVNTLDLDDVDTQAGFSQLNGLLEQVTEASASQSVIRAHQAAGLEKEFHEEIQRVDEEAEERTRLDEESMPVSTKQINGGIMEAVSEGITVITEGTSIKGDITSEGGISIQGNIQGNITCSGKLVVTGVLEGNSSSAEFFADAAKVDGEINSSGVVKIGGGSVVIGNITATSAVVAGAVKGDIDVQGPVVVDTSAVIMGNIKCRSVQINNGAVVEGFCSQCYADIDMQSLFEEKKGN